MKAYLLLALLLMSCSSIDSSERNASISEPEQQVANPNEGAQAPVGQPSEPENQPDACSEYTYSTCPSNCVKRCISSGYGRDADGNLIGTADCDGRGSCAAT